MAGRQRDDGAALLRRRSELSSARCHNLRRRGFPALADMPALRGLSDFNSYTTITDRTPELLAGMEALERITFDACHRLTDACVMNLARLPSLKKLRVSG